MAVPKKKTSKSVRNHRRSHHALKKQNLVVDQTTGELKLPHHISHPVDKKKNTLGHYNGQVVISKADDNQDE